MSLRFRGGGKLQRGRGIGGLLRLAKNVFSPIVKSIGKTAIQAATSKAGQKAIGAIKDQAVNSALNMVSDAISGNSLSKSAKAQYRVGKEAIKTIVKNQIQDMQAPIMEKKKKKSRRHVVFQPNKYR